MIEIVYFGADDCFYCQHWEAARKPELLALIRGRSARLVEIRGESLDKPILERHYPPQYRWLHKELGDIRGVPRFVLLLDGRIDMKVHGTSNYTALLEPRIRTLLAQRGR
jgi:hypothetical protein